MCRQCLSKIEIIKYTNKLLTYSIIVNIIQKCFLSLHIVQLIFRYNYSNDYNIETRRVIIHIMSHILTSSSHLLIKNGIVFPPTEI